MVQWTSLLLLLVSVQTTMAALSELCQKETETLANNTALLAATPPSTLTCNINLGETNSCQDDDSSYSSNYKNACVAAGGQFHEKDVNTDCTTADPNGNIIILNTALCLGSSCTIEEFEEELSTVLYPKLEQDLSQQGIQCSVSGARSWETNLSSLSIGIVLMSALSIFGSLQ